MNQLHHATHEDSDGTGYCRGCGTTIGERHHDGCDVLGVSIDAHAERVLAELHLMKVRALAEIEATIISANRSLAQGRRRWAEKQDKLGEVK